MLAHIKSLLRREFNLNRSASSTCLSLLNSPANMRNSPPSNVTVSALTQLQQWIWIARKRNNKELVSTWHSRSRDRWPDLQFPLSLQFAPVAKVRYVWTKLTFFKYHNWPTTGIWSIIVLPASPVGSSLPKAPCKITVHRGKTRALCDKMQNSPSNQGKSKKKFKS